MWSEATLRVGTTSGIAVILVSYIRLIIGVGA